DLVLRPHVQRRTDAADEPRLDVRQPRSRNHEPTRGTVATGVITKGREVAGRAHLSAVVAARSRRQSIEIEIRNRRAPGHGANALARAARRLVDGKPSACGNPGDVATHAAVVNALAGARNLTAIDVERAGFADVWRALDAGVQAHEVLDDLVLRRR